MCGVCGCSDENSVIRNLEPLNNEDRAAGKSTLDKHSFHHQHGLSVGRASTALHPHSHDVGSQQSHAQVFASKSDSQSSDTHNGSMLIEIEKDILYRNSLYAEENRQFLSGKEILTLNFVSSPGSGKTTLLVETIKALRAVHKTYVIEGDQQTSNDAERIRETGAKAVQINTGKGCHLDAHTVGHALEHLELDSRSLLFIENVGNLVCPASFDLGENHKVALLSVTEGDDKPIKYPDMFAASSVMLLNKIDLLPYVKFDTDRCIEYARQVNPDIRVIMLSAQDGQGLPEWFEWVSTAQTTASKPAFEMTSQENAQLSSS
jgi:hydrogenase nickel incorporation protein HypB